MHRPATAHSQRGFAGLECLFALESLFASECFGDGALRVLLNQLQMVLVAKALRVDLVDILGARWPGGKPAVRGLDLDAAERLVVARRFGPDSRDRIAGKFAYLELLGPEGLERV